MPAGMEDDPLEYLPPITRSKKRQTDFNPRRHIRVEEVVSPRDPPERPWFSSETASVAGPHTIKGHIADNNGPKLGNDGSPLPELGKMDFSRPSKWSLGEYLVAVQARPEILQAMVREETRREEKAAREKQAVIEEENWVTFIKRRQQGAPGGLGDYEGYIWSSRANMQKHLATAIQMIPGRLCPTGIRQRLKHWHSVERVPASTRQAREAAKKARRAQERDVAAALRHYESVRDNPPEDLRAHEVIEAERQSRDQTRRRQQLNSMKPEESIRSARGKSEAEEREQKEKEEREKKEREQRQNRERDERKREREEREEKCRVRRERKKKEKRERKRKRRKKRERRRKKKKKRERKRKRRKKRERKRKKKKKRERKRKGRKKRERKRKKRKKRERKRKKGERKRKRRRKKERKRKRSKERRGKMN